MPDIVYVIGIGPGSPDYLTPATRVAVRKASLLLGGQRALGLFSFPKEHTFLLKAPLEAAIDAIGAVPPGENAAVLVSGDPGLYSFLRLLKKHFAPEVLEVIPGISSFQLAFARLKLPYEDYALLSFHGKEPELAWNKVRRALGGGLGVALLCDGRMTPAVIARYLLERGVANRDMAVLTDLSYPTESILKTSLAELACGQETPGNAVVVIPGD